MQRTPERYVGGSGVRVASPWSVKMTNFSPALAAAAATSSGPLRPSDRLEWTWMTPGTEPSVNDVSRVRRTGGSVNATKTATAATKAAVAHRIFFTGNGRLEASALFQRGRLVGLLPREL